MPDDYLRSIEPLDRDRPRWAFAVAPPRPNPTALSLPSSGVSSLDLGRLWQRRRPFFFVYAVTFAAILRRQSRPQESAQDDKWSFCLTAGTLCPANQERQ